jgi:hypothetical protein
MNRPLIILAACLLAACAGGARNAPPAAVYDFGPPVERLAEGSPLVERGARNQGAILV